LPAEKINETWVVYHGDLSGEFDSASFEVLKLAREFIKRNLSEGTPYHLMKHVTYEIETGVAG
jgi:hypothetical protein